MLSRTTCVPRRSRVFPSLDLHAQSHDKGRSPRPIRPSGLRSGPRRPNQAPPPRRKTNRPQTHPATCIAPRLRAQGPPLALACRRSWPVAAAGPDARPHYCALPQRPSRWLRVPGRGAHGSSSVGGAGGLGARGRALPRGSGRAAAAPPPLPPGTVASAARALGLASEPKGQI